MSKTGITILSSKKLSTYCVFWYKCKTVCNKAEYQVTLTFLIRFVKRSIKQERKQYIIAPEHIVCQNVLSYLSVYVRVLRFSRLKWRHLQNTQLPFSDKKCKILDKCNGIIYRMLKFYVSLLSVFFSFLYYMQINSSLLA